MLSKEDFFFIVGVFWLVNFVVWFTVKLWERK
jgi:hypothetical protein